MKLWDGLDDVVQENIQTMEICAAHRSRKAHREKIKDKAYAKMLYASLNCKTGGKLVNLPIHGRTNKVFQLKLARRVFRMKNFYCSKFGYRLVS